MNIKRRINKIGVAGIISVGIIILLISRFVNVYLNQEKNLHYELFMLFTEAVENDKEKQITKEKKYYNSEKFLNNISGEEKHAWATQAHLTMRDPNRHILDSLFGDILQKENINAKTAIRCVRSGKVIHSSPDSLFYKKATSLEPIVYRIDENKEKNITLQAYVDIPVWTVLGRVGWFAIFSFSFLILLVGGCGIYFKKLKENIERIIRLLRTARQGNNELLSQQKVKLAELQAKKREVERISQLQAEFIEQKQTELFALQNEIIPLDPKQKTVWISLPCGLFFDEKQGVLRDENGQTLCLKNNSLRLFRHFVKAENYKLVYEDICTDVLERPVKNGVDESDRESVSTAVHRLKECLKPFPCIKIVALRGTGYEMYFQ